MENAIYLGLSRQVALDTNMQIIANNVANMNTTGYRAQNLVFQEFISDPRGGDDELSFVYDERQYENTTPGAIKFTSNPLDVALNGPGFIGIQAPGGEVQYTRDGSFQISANGTLVTGAGFPVADGGGAEITIPEGSSDISIDENGFVSNQDGQLGQIMVVEFENTQTLEAQGNNLYRTDAAAQEANNTIVQQGALEGSNVQGVVEVTRMVETLRSFQSVQQVLQSENERLRTAIQRLTRGS